ncbi:MAG TPA: thioredoxin family protein [Luteolibacter sp.]|nr:thioredoxin family protein [Luteolibacter sp.]
MTQTRAAMLSLFCTGIAFAGGEGWTTDYEAAKKEAASSKKSLLIDFTGSDWCGWCIKLNDEVFKHDTFKNGVKDKFVLLELDFPNDKSKQTEAVQKQNAELSKKYGIEGFPTILLTDEEGRPFASTGYEAGGPAEYVKHLDGLLEKRKTRDEGFAAASKLEGPAKAKALVGVLESMELSDGTVAGFYGSTIDDIKKSDPEDSSGFAKKMAEKERMSKFDAELNELGEKKDFDGALALIDKTLKEDLPLEDKQRVTLMKALVFAEQGKFDEAIKGVDEAKKVAPESEMAGQLDGLKRQLEAMKGHDKAE